MFSMLNYKGTNKDSSAVTLNISVSTVLCLLLKNSIWKHFRPNSIVISST